MFHSRFNTIKARNNREGFLGLFDKAEARIYSCSAGYEGIAPASTAGYLADPSDDKARGDMPKQLAASEFNRFAQSVCLETNGAKDDQSFFFGDMDTVAHQGENIPDTLTMPLRTTESDEDVNNSVKDVDALVENPSPPLGLMRAKHSENRAVLLNGTVISFVNQY